MKMFRSIEFTIIGLCAISLLANVWLGIDNQKLRSELTDSTNGLLNANQKTSSNEDDYRRAKELLQQAISNAENTVRLVESKEVPLEILMKDNKVAATIRLGETLDGKTIKGVNLVGAVVLKNTSMTDKWISFQFRPAQAMRLKIVNRDEKTIGVLSCHLAYAGQDRGITVVRGMKTIEEPITMHWSILEGKEALTPGDYKMVVEFKQGDKVFKSEAVPFTLKPPKDT